MKTINLRDYYPHYKEDEFYEVPDAIADLLREFERKEKNYIRKIKRYRAYFSLDVGDKIESETLLSQNDPADILELRMLFEIAYQSLDMLTRKQGLRVYKYLFLGMSIEENIGGRRTVNYFCEKQRLFLFEQAFRSVSYLFFN